MEFIHLEGKVKPRTVKLNGKRLSAKPSQKLVNHSPDGFAWGYNGSGPAQLALAVMLAVIENEDIAQVVYQDFKREYIATLDIDRDFDVKWNRGDMMRQVNAWLKGRGREDLALAY